jgi:hypothetical protein
MDLTYVLKYLRPGEAWTLDGDEYAGLEWLDSTVKPTEDECLATWEEVKQDHGFIPLRLKRKELLAFSDWTQTLDAPVDREAWAEYRQALRDLPENTIDPTNVVWPTPPA